MKYRIFFLVGAKRRGGGGKYNDSEYLHGDHILGGRGMPPRENLENLML